MWSSLTALLRCPLCRERLDLSVFEEGAVPKPALEPQNAWVDSGILSCAGCKTWFPVTHGVPVLLPYTTPAHQDFAQQHANRIQALVPAHHAPDGQPARGEHLVMRSFSTEWLEYDFDGVIWEMDYDDHEARFLAEMGSYAPRRDRPGRFLEIGCGLGITTAMAHKNFGSEAIGVDLSLAAWRAAATNRGNPLLHFVQASVFALPFAPATFDTIYTRGVLHHTYSTRDAFHALAPLGAPGGTLYVWVYGSRSIADNLFRRAVYAVEAAARYILNRGPEWVSRVVLAPLALSYMVFNWARRLFNPRIQPYNYRRALHAARDRFTPEFAHRQDAEEVSRWFREAGYVDLEVVDWRAMPSADHDDYRRNTGVRGRRPAAGRGAGKASETAAQPHANDGAWPVMVLAHNEQRHITSCLDSIFASEPHRRFEVFVMANGCSDRTEDLVRDYARRRPEVKLVSIALGDKCNAWNVFVHETVAAQCAARDMYFFMDGDARIVPGSLAAMARALTANPHAHAASAVPASGRNLHPDREEILGKHGLVGNLYAVRGSFVERLRRDAVRMPLKLEGDDGLIGALIKWDLAPDRNNFDNDRIVPCADAAFEFEPMSLLRAADWRSYWKRAVRYARRRYEFQLLRRCLKERGITVLPRDITDLYPQASSLPLRWDGIHTVSNWVALQQMRKYRRSRQ